MSGDQIYRRIVLGAFYLFCGVLYVAVWPSVSWPQRAIDILLILGVGRMLYSEVRLGR